MEMSQYDVSKDSSLKRYFKFMLFNQKMSVQFSSKKIKEIIKHDLCINLDTPTFTELLIEAFAFYMQSWPEWNEALKSTIYSDELYQSLVTYLREKLLYLKIKKREIDFGETNKLDQICIPADFQHFIASGIADPYVLNIQIPREMWNKKGIQFERFNKTDMVFDLTEIEPSHRKYNLNEIFNHPNVWVEFKLPGLIHLSKSVNFKVERFIHSYDSTPNTQKKFDVFAEQVINIAKPKVYSYNLLRLFFNSLAFLLRHKFKNIVSDSRRIEIELFCASILKDIRETNLCNMTVCEGYNVEYHINQASYSTNEFIDFDPDELNEYVLYKNVFYPIGSYSLWFCTLLPSDISSSGAFNLFTSLDNGNKNLEKTIVDAVNYCISYKCLKCNTYYSYDALQEHLNTVHPLKSPVTCNKCGKSVTVDALLQWRWWHAGCTEKQSIVL